MTALPALFISHGSPMLALEDGSTTQFLRALPKQFPKPNAIIIASAHWETQLPMLTGSAHLETIHDFSGFPKELYDLHYHAAGNPALAARVQSLLAKTGIDAGIDPRRGLDHGAWNPLFLMYPQADIPVIQLSIQPHRDARWHYHMGQALAPLREDNILIIGTGNLTHNLREAFRGHPTTPAWVTAFAQWVHEQAEHDALENLLNWQALAPHARENHPTPEHFLPFFIALGAGGAQNAKRLYEATELGVLAMDAYSFST